MLIPINIGTNRTQRMEGDPERKRERKQTAPREDILERTKNELIHNIEKTKKGVRKRENDDDDGDDDDHHLHHHYRHHHDNHAQYPSLSVSPSPCLT